ncbi:MAG: SseB family protein [Marinosulfonomonas sp.]|nr:SseB family protein [Marinosulfonomonas sp.]
MADMTALDHAHEMMQANEQDKVARLRFYERMADTELCVLLEEESDLETLSPKILTAEGAQFCLVFDTEERLAEFATGTVPYAALSGRSLVNMLAGQDVGLGVNLDVAPSSILIPPDALAWLRDMLSEKAQEATDLPVKLAAPVDLSDALFAALSSKLALATGLADAAYLVDAAYKSGRAGYLLAVINPVAGSEGALVQAVNEALVFTGEDDLQLDVSFFGSEAPILPHLVNVGLMFEIPVPEPAKIPGAAPGMDKNNPPKLR